MKSIFYHLIPALVVTLFALCATIDHFWTRATAATALTNPPNSVVCDGKGIYTWTDEDGNPSIFYETYEEAKGSMESYQQRMKVWAAIKDKVIQEAMEAKTMQWHPCPEEQDVDVLHLQAK